MRTVVKITADPSTGDLLVNGELKTEVVATTGSELVLDIDVSDATILGDANTIWVMLDPVDTDIKRVSDTGSAFKVPYLSALQGFGIPSERGKNPRESGGRLVMDIAKAPLSDLLSAQIAPFRGDVDGDLVNVAISAGGQAYYAPEDFRVEYNGVNKYGVVRLEPQAIQSAGVRYRVKHRIPTWVSRNGQRKGQISLKPNIDNRFKTAWICTDDYKTTPIKVVVKSEPSNQLAPLVKSRLPASRAEDSDGIIQLLQDFFDYACREGGPLYALNHVDDFRDPDKAPEAFLDLLLAERAPFLPAGAVADRKLVLKHAVRFFENRGNPRSWSFLSRVIFGVDCDLTYPADYLFRGSDGDWRQYTSVKGISIRNGLQLRPDLETRIRKTLGKQTLPIDQFPDDSLLPNLLGTRVRGLDSRAEGIVEEVIQQVYGAVTVTEILLSSVIGSFVADELVVPVEGLDLSSIPSDHRSLSNFHFLLVNQITEITPPTTGNYAPGVKASFANSEADVLLLNVDANGLPTKFEILDSGYVSGGGETATLPDVSGVSHAITFTAAPQRELPGQWVGGTSFASDNQIRTQDGWIHQLFSYVVESPIPEVKHKPYFKAHLHPAGFQMFSKFVEPVTVVSASAGSLNRYVSLPAGRKSIYAGDVTDKHIDVYVGGRLIDSTEWYLVGSGIRTFVALHDSVDVSIEQQAVVSIKNTAASRDPKLFDVGSDNLEAVTSVNGTVDYATQNPEDAVTKWGTYGGNYVAAQLSDLDNTLWYRFVQFNNDEDGQRCAKPGIRFTENGYYATVAAATPVGTSGVGAALAFVNEDQANSFTFGANFKRIVT